MSKSRILLYELFFHVLFIALISIYGTQVCPHVSALGNFQITIYFVLASIPRFLTRIFFLRGKGRTVRKQFLIDLAYFLTMGFLVGGYNTYYHDFPVESTLKIMLGAVALGTFTAIIYALLNDLKSEKYISFLKEIMVFIFFLVVIINSVWILLVLEDISFAVDQGGMGMRFLGAIITEFIFVVAVLFFYIGIIIWLYRSKIKMAVKSQLAVMQLVADGDLSRKVDVQLNNEFGSIAESTNNMIDGLKQKQFLQKSIDKLVSEDVSEIIINSIRDGNFKPERKKMCILFTDIRGFTEQCATSEPEEFVSRLNNHFGAVVSVVKRHDGYVNKFIGDALMACFDGPSASENGLKVADDLAALMDERKDFDIGIGIAYGDVMSGLIGSEDRLEYTVIGPAVNLAARLEAMTRDLECRIVVCGETVSDHLENHGFETIVRPVKGFSEEMTVYYK